MKTPLLLLLVAAAACQVPAPETYVPPAMSRPATEEEYGVYLTQGTATITGQAFLVTRGGEAKRAAGRDVVIDPLTPYAREWFQHVSGKPVDVTTAPQDSLFIKARRHTVADADGRFKFVDLPAGTYLIRTTVTWEVATGVLWSPTSSQGGVVGDTVTIRHGETRDIIMNKELP